MRLALKAAAASALLALGATLALAQTSAQTTPSDSPSKAEPGAPQQGPGKQAPNPNIASDWPALKRTGCPRQEPDG